MESKLGTDLSSVRIHTGSKAAKSATDVNARAYTVGDDIVFNRGEYAPGTPQGNRILAHELTHVAQQSRESPVLQRQPTAVQSNEALARAYADEFLRAEYTALWHEANKEARKKLDVSSSGTATSGGEVWFASSSRRKARKLAEQKAKENVDRLFSQRGVPGNSRSEAVADLIKHKQEKLQKKSREQAEKDAVRSVDAELAKMADETTNSVCTQSQIRQTFLRTFLADIRRRPAAKQGTTVAAQQKVAKEAYEKARKEVKNEIQAKVKTNIPDEATQEARVKQRIDSDDVAGRAINTTEDSAVDAFETIGRRLDSSVERGESTSITANITIRPDPKIPISVSLTGSISASREPDSDELEVNAMLKLGLSADIKIATAGFNVRKPVRAGGSDTQHTMAALSYALYRHYTGLGTEYMANLLWGAGQDGKDSYQVKAQRWAAATETVLMADPDSFGMVGYGADVHASAGDDVGIAELSGGGQASFDRYELYNKSAVQAQLGSYAGAKLTNSKHRRELEKSWQNQRNIKETAVSVWFKGKIGQGSASGSVALNGAYTYNTGDAQDTSADGEHTLKLGGTITAPGLRPLTEVVYPLGERIVQACKRLQEKLQNRDPNVAQQSSLFDFRGEDLGSLLASTASATADQQKSLQKDTALDRVHNDALSQKADPFLDSSKPDSDPTGQVLSADGSAGFGFGLERTIPAGRHTGESLATRVKTGGETTFTVSHTKSSSYSFDVGVMKVSLSMSRSKILRQWERQNGQWTQTFDRIRR
jgi:hypothetical protein